MHHLDRTPIPSPACLSCYRHGLNTWGDLSSDERQTIRVALEEFQGRRCAYCECNLDQYEHIEHFRQRDRYPQETFNWDNFFLSCNHDDSCGRHKDRCSVYNHQDLIKPDVEDPEQYFVFISNGTIALRAGLTDVQQHRARETLRILHLDAQWGPLRQMRRVAAIGYIETAQAIWELASTPRLQDWVPLLEEELAQIENLPFCTAIKHVLTPQGARAE